MSKYSSWNNWTNTIWKVLYYSSDDTVKLAMISINSEDLRRQILLNDCLKTLKDFSGTYIKYNIFLFYYLNLKDKAYVFWGYFLNSKLVLVKRVIYL